MPQRHARLAYFWLLNGSSWSHCPFFWLEQHLFPCGVTWYLTRVTLICFTLGQCAQLSPASFLWGPRVIGQPATTVRAVAPSPFSNRNRNCFAPPGTTEVLRKQMSSASPMELPSLCVWALGLSAQVRNWLLPCVLVFVWFLSMRTLSNSVRRLASPCASLSLEAFRYYAEKTCWRLFLF